MAYLFSYMQVQCSMYKLECLKAVNLLFALGFLLFKKGILTTGTIQTTLHSWSMEFPNNKVDVYTRHVVYIVH